MCPDDVGWAVELLDRRRDVLARLGEGPCHVRDLCDSLDVSRSTVNRAVRDLESAGWIERTGDGYVRTTTGSLALEGYRDQVAALRAVQEYDDALTPLPEGTPLDPSVLDDATVRSDADAFELSRFLRSAIEDATAVRGVWPSVSDDRTVRAVARVADDGGSVALAVDADGRSTLRSIAPETFGGDGSATPTVESTDAVPDRLGVFVVETPEERRVLLVVYEGRGSVHAVAEAPPDEGVLNWVDGVFGAVGVPRSTDAGLTAPTGTSGAADWSADARDVLRSQGFVPVDDDALARRERRRQGSLLRTTPTLSAVDAGLTLDREHVVDGQRRELAVDLVDALADVGHLALVGAPGSGKSTTCKSVACRWRDREYGPVCYRESESNAMLDDPLSLAASLAAAEGRPLVVVEDAIRPAANAVFETMEELPPDAGVSFLFDARRSEWATSPEQLDPRREALRHDAVETVPVPALDDAERQRLHLHVDAIFDGPMPPFEEFVGDETSADDSLASPHATGGEGAGELLTLAHRYGRIADGPIDADGHDAGPLSREVRAVYDEVADDPDGLVVATLVNVLNAAGLPFERDLVDALTVSDDGLDADAVASTMTTLRGQVFFPGDGGMDLVHDAWSQAFLAHLVERRDAASAHRTFAAAVGPLFDLVTDPELRSAVVRYRQGDAPTVAAFDEEPEHWRDVVVDRVYDLGRESPKLAPLYGHPEYTELALPERCSSWCRRHALVGRAKMQIDVGEYDVALAECDRLEEVAETVAPDRQAVLLRARSLEAQCVVAEQRADFERAREFGTESLELVRDVDDRRGEASVLNGLGLIAWYRGDIDEAERRLRDALSIYDEVQSKQSEADALNNLGIVLRERGNYAEAADYFRESHRQRREIGARVMALSSTINLGVIARDRGDLDEAVGWLRTAIEEARVLGVKSEESNANRALGNVLRWRGELAESARRLERALELAESEELRYDECLSLRGLGATRREQGRLDAADAHFSACEALAEEIGDGRDRALARAHRGLLALARDDPAEAASTLTEAVETLESLGRVPGLARAKRWHARALDAADEHDRARRAYEAAIEQYESVGATPYLRETLDELTEVCERTGADETAATYRDRREGLGANN